MLDFKKVKNLIDDRLFAAMGNYNPFGPHEDEYKPYQKLKWLKANIAQYEENDKVEEFSLILYKILKWVQMAIETRAEDCKARKLDEHNHELARQNAIAAHDARQAKYREGLAAAQDVSD